MEPATMVALAPAAASVFGSILGSSGQSEANSVNAFMANQVAADNRNFAQNQWQLQSEFAERMSSTAYQRAVQDMEKAGLNPMLAYSQGGASSPTSPATSATANAPHFENVIGKGLSSGAEAARTVSDLMTAEQNRKIKSPVVELAEAARDVIKGLKEIVNHFMPGNAPGVVINAIEDLGRTVESLNIRDLPAVVSKKVVDKLNEVKENVMETVKKPGKLLQGLSNSATGYIDTKSRVISDRIHSVEKEIGTIIHGGKSRAPDTSGELVPHGGQSNFKRYQWKFNVPAR